MLNEMKAVKNLIQYLEDRKDELVDNEKEWYNQSLHFLNDYLTDTQDELELEYAEKYVPEYYNF